MNPRPPVKIDREFEAEARAMAKAMQTGELPPRTAPFYERVKYLAEMHWTAKALAEGKGGRA